PHTIRRWFKKNYDMTFHQFQRMLRINYAFTNIRKGESVTFSAFESGYESLSGFNESYRSIFGESASKSKHRTVVNTLRFSSPIGSLIACASETGVCFLGFVGQKKLEENVAAIQKELNAVMIPGPNPHLTQVRKEVGEYFKASRTRFSVPLHLIGTDFRKRVWEALLNIPYGTTLTYGQQASTMNHERAVRAVASANAMNKISIIIPCHRVIGANGELSGYAGGLPKKQWLLDLEETNSGRKH
ncbi:MAG: methylated-DNA--[protein]-cysteine S-methyltransferase, partial [Verrucomicrobia bacterium]|nr:methylated-DNA--[protein]-cysteine S-methyltransferase [Verrucomicrobiota bacterium]